MSERSWKDKVVMWNEGGISSAEIVKRCEQIGKKVSKSKVLRLLKKTYVVRKPYTPSSIIDKEKIQPIFKYIFDAFMSESQEDEEKIVKEIQAQFGETVRSTETVKATITPTIVKRIREAQGIGTDHVRYGHSVRMVNRPPRVAFCTHHLSVGTMFTHHAFTDESMVQSGKRGRFCFVLKGDTSRRIKPKFKHPPQLMIWGGVSWEGATPLVVMRNKVRIDGGVYQSMLHSTYLKWAEEKFGGNVVLVQDNAACHTSESTQAFFKRSGVQLILRMQKQMRRVIEKQGEPVYD
ncbi:hypothetical protein PRIPAC_72609 [Pristionchus pacificus]|uniref:Uncharacterized protein n=1 Tax=Pristionchus pacificus TaxID=54126 RepID=A0A2A6C7Z7_PRIPA|nr:hypothetical protein PRIPAC_72609 [Pristionchus pacificus]|eukprot:PDM74226.1 hypothetical protein PRIPAC_41582 [Pristionchus pacificus]